MPVSNSNNGTSQDNVRSIRALNQTESEFLETTLKATNVDEEISKREQALNQLDAENGQFRNSTRSSSRYYLLAIVILASLVIDYMFLSPAVDYLLNLTGLKPIAYNERNIESQNEFNLK